MEVTNGLLSNLVETKSMEAVLAPIASQVSQLILVCESNTGWRPSETVRKSAETVKQIILDLINVAKMKAAESTHQTYKSDMLNACDMLSVAADNFYTNALSLQQSPGSKNVRRAVVQAAKDTLQGTMRVLLVQDEAEVQAIVDAAYKVNTALNTLMTASSMNELVSMFRIFMDTMVHLTGLASRRQLELIRTRQREKVIMGLGVLKKAVPLLNKALQSYVKHPDSPQAKVSRDYAVKQIETGLTDITDAVSNRFMEEDYLGLEEAGFFVCKLDQLLEALTEVGREDLPGNFEMWTQDSITHSMAVAHQCADLHRDLIINNCQRILLQKGRLMELFVTFKAGNNPASAEVREDYDEVCEGLIDEFCDLERHVNMAVLHLIVVTFCQTTETLDKLVQTAMQQAVTGGEWFSVLNQHIVVFGEHADKVCQVASLAAASSTDGKRVRRIRLCIHRLEQLDPEIVPAAVACLKSGGDRQAIQHMRLLKEEWRHEFDELLQVLDDMTDPRIFMDVSAEQLVQDLNTCNGLLIVHDLEEIVDIFQTMAGKARRVVQVAKQIADAHEDPLYRNGLMVYVERLRKVITGTRESLSRAVEQPDNRTELETLKRRLHRIPEGVGLVREALSKQAHPDILSPLRLNVRHSRGKLQEKKKKKSRAGLHDADQNKENEGGAVGLAADNPFLASPPPYWSRERVENESRNLASLSSDDAVARGTQSSGEHKSKDRDSSERQRDRSGPDLDCDVSWKRHVRMATPDSEQPLDGPTQRPEASSRLTDTEDGLKGEDSADKLVRHSPGRSGKTGSAKLSPALKPKDLFKAKFALTSSDSTVNHSDPNSPTHWQGNVMAPRGTADSKKSSPPRKTGLDYKTTLGSELKDLDNPIVNVAREMCALSKRVEGFTKAGQDRMSHTELLRTAKTLSKCGQTMVKFLQGIASHCLDKRFSKDMSYHIHHVSMATVQLDIISSVSMTSADDRSAEDMLMKATKSLMSAVAEGLKSAETASVKGLQEPTTGAGEYVNAFILAMQWKERWEKQRHLEASSEDKDELGLRRISLHNPPSLAELVLY